MFYNSLRTVVISPPVEDFYFTAHRFCGAGSKIVANLLRKRDSKSPNSFHRWQKGSAIPLLSSLACILSLRKMKPEKLHF